MEPYSDLAEANLTLYWMLVGAGLDVVIWCLGPLVRPDRPYGRLRRALAVATCTACRVWIRTRGVERSRL